MELRRGSYLGNEGKWDRLDVLGYRRFGNCDSDEPLFKHPSNSFMLQPGAETKYPGIRFEYAIVIPGSWPMAEILIKSPRPAPENVSNLETVFLVEMYM